MNKWAISTEGVTIRILTPAKGRHTHAIYDKVSKEVASMRCEGPSCPICKMVEQMRKHSFLERAIAWFKRLRYPSNELDPYDDDYVGHNIARQLLVPCICEKNRINIMCPWHGR